MTNLSATKRDQLIDACGRLAAIADQLEQPGAWPQEQFEILAQADILKWVIPEEYGGLAVSSEDLTEGYTQLAAADLVTTFILTQRNGACQRIAGCDNEPLKASLLPKLARGELFATVGVSHLTTSRQHVAKPAVQVTPEGDGFVLDGQIPWVTSGLQADIILTGGTLEGGDQILVALPRTTTGVVPSAPARLLALDASATGTVKLTNVRVPPEQLVAGPEPQVMAGGKGGGAGSVTTSALAVGLSLRSLTALAAAAEQRPDLNETVEPFRQEWEALRHDMLLVASGNLEGDDDRLTPAAIRQRANSLVLRITQAELVASKGAGFVKGHPAERAVREAMFFLVWSCPQPVAEAAMREFTCRFGG